MPPLASPITKMDKVKELRVERLILVDSEGQEVARLWAERGRGGTESLTMDIGGFNLAVILTGEATRICVGDARVPAGHTLFDVGIDANGIGFVVDNRASVLFGLSGDPTFQLSVFAVELGKGPGWTVKTNEQGVLRLFEIEESGANRIVFDSAAP